MTAISSMIGYFTSSTRVILSSAVKLGEARGRNHQESRNDGRKICGGMVVRVPFGIRFPKGTTVLEYRTCPAPYHN